MHTIRQRAGLAAVVAVLVAVAGTPSYSAYRYDAPGWHEAPEVVIPWDEASTTPTAVFEEDNEVITRRVEIRPATPVVGETVTARLTATDALGKSYSGHIHIGERRGGQSNMTCARGPTRPDAPPTSQPSPKTTTNVTQFTIEAPGRHRVVGRFEAFTCTQRYEATANGWIDVVAGPIAPNLRHTPRATVQEVVNTQPGGYIGRMFRVEAFDHDGYLGHVTFDWGDGKPTTMVTANPRQDCSSPMRHLPRGEEYPHSLEMHHQFVGSGRFVVRAAVTTTACDGRHPQTAHAEWVVEMP
ncbi:MAG TPA: hypothetical protein VM938_04845 [Acidimicrobiales bacterium]|nr:hypothetical protein [Acidimicrobiales bacterium]